MCLNYLNFSMLLNQVKKNKSFSHEENKMKPIRLNKQIPTKKINMPFCFKLQFYY